MSQSLDNHKSEDHDLLLSLRDRQLRTLFETTLDAIALSDSQGRYIDVNPAACELFGVEREQLLGRCIIEFTEPDFNFQAASQQFQQPEKMRGELSLVRADGQIRVVEYVTKANFLPHRHLSVMRDITKRKRAEIQVQELKDQLQQAHNQLQEAGIEPVSLASAPDDYRLKQIARHIPGFIYQFCLNPDGTANLPYASDGMPDIYGVSREEAHENATQIFNFVHPEDVDRVNQSILESASHLTPWYCEHRVCLPNGRLLWLLGHSTPQQELDGSINWYGYIQNITEIKAAEIALRQSENKFRSIIENINDMVYIINSDSTFSYVTSQFKEVMGYELAELLNKSFALFVAPEDLPKCKDAFHRCIRGEQVRGLEYRVLHRDGKYHWHSSNVSALKDENGQIISCLGIARYIHHTKQAQIALEESNSRWQLAIEGAGDGTWDWNLKTEEVIFSRQWKAMLGYAEEEITNTLEEWKSRLHPDDLSQCYQDIAQHLNGQNSNYRNEHRLRCQDGTYKWILARGQVTEWDKNGQPLRFIGTHCDISDRKTAELELEQFFSVALDLLCIADISGHFRHLNRAWENTLGYSIQELEGQIFLDFVHPDDLASTLEAMSDLSQQKQIPEFINRYRAKDGTYRYIEWRAAPCGDLIYAAARDITDRKQTEIELAASQSELMALFNAMQDVIIVLNSEGRYLKIAPTSVPDLYKPSDELLGKKLHEVLPQNVADLFLHTIRQAIIDRSITHLEYSLPIGDRLVWFDARISPMSEDRVVWVARDITNRKRQEQSLRLIVEGTAAKTGEEFFKSCVQYLAQVLEVRYALIAEFVDSEKKSAKTLAFWAGDDFGDNFTYNLAGTPCQNADSHVHVCRYQKTVQSCFPENHKLVALQAESYAALLIVDVAGNHLGIIAVLDTKPMVQDLEMQSGILRIFATRAGAEIERIEAESAVRQSEIQLRLQSEELAATLKKLQNTQTQLIQAEKMSSLGQLVAGIAHEINNPVSFIYGNIKPATDYASDLIELIHLYQNHYPSPPQEISGFIENIDLDYLASDFERLLKSMKNGATRISDIVKSLRTFSRLDEADLKQIEIHENIESTLVILQNRLNGRAGKPEVHLTKKYGNLPLVKCYGGLLNQVFMNLLVNAIDAIEQQRSSLDPRKKLDYIGRIAITTSLTAENQVAISIQDNGCGMSFQVQEKIFNPFFTTKPVGKGTGMGLATSYQIVTENHRGHLQCFSNSGEGAEFTITLSIEGLISVDS
jgi:PAS domain S-box-containing protein